MTRIFPQVSAKEIEAVKKLSYDGRERLMYEINSTNPAQIFQAAGASSNPDKCKIICPACGNGTGSDGTPVETTRASDGVWLYNCFKCDKFKGDLMKIIAADGNLNLDNLDDFCEALAIGAELIHSPIDLPPVRNTIQKEKPAPPPAELLKLIHEDIAAAQANLNALPENQRRSLTDITLKHFGFGYLAQWTPPKSRLEGKNVPASRRLIIPTQNHYNAVALPAERQSMDKQFHKMHAGKMDLFNPDALEREADLILIVEGEIDAASIWQAFKGDISVVAVLGAANWGATLRPHFDKLAGKKILILFDADDAGRKNAENLRGSLLSKNIPATAKFFYDYLSDASKEKFGVKVDANQLLCERGVSALRDLTQKLIDCALSDFETIELQRTFRSARIRFKGNTLATEGSSHSIYVPHERSDFSMDNDNKKFTDKQDGKDQNPFPPHFQGVGGRKSPPTEIPTPDKAEKTDYLKTSVVAQILGVTRKAVEYWRKKGWFNADMIDHSGVYYYTVERVMQLKEVYRPDWQTAWTGQPLQEIPHDYKPPIKKTKDRPAPVGVEPFSDDERAFYFAGTFSDMQNARLLERFCADDVRFLTDEGIWLTYDSGVWTRRTKDSSHILPKVYQFVDKIDATIPKIIDRDFKKLAVRRRNCFEDHKRINPAINLLRGCSSIRITAEDLDRHKNLLCAQNGIIDLETGRLFDADPHLLITRQLSVAYDPHADSAAIEKFFAEIMPDEKTRAGLIRWLAYCLTGETLEEKFLIWYGGGANGKGVLSKITQALLYLYAASLPQRALLVNSKFTDDANKATTALNCLEGARFAISDELPADAELNLSMIKKLSGGDPIELRRLYGEFRKLENYSKINICGNYLPRVENVNDYALLRRMLNMPFTVTFGKDKPLDPKLKDKLLQPENLRGLLKILVEQAQAWYRDGLIISDLMKRTTQEHLNQNNFVEQFIEESDKYELNKNLSADNSVKAKDFIDDLKAEYYAQCARFNRKDLIKIIESVAEYVEYMKNNHNSCVFKGIGKSGTPTQSNIDFDGNDVDPRMDAMP